MTVTALVAIAATGGVMYAAIKVTGADTRDASSARADLSQDTPQGANAVNAFAAANGGVLNSNRIFGVPGASPTSAGVFDVKLAGTHPPPSGGPPYTYNAAGDERGTGSGGPYRYNEDGFAQTGFDPEGYDEDGLMADGYDDVAPRGYDLEGFDRNGYDLDGIKRDGTSGYDDSGTWIGPPGGDPWDQPADTNEAHGPPPDIPHATETPPAAPESPAGAKKALKPKAHAEAKGVKDDGSNRTFAQLRSERARIDRALTAKRLRIARKNGENADGTIYRGGEALPS